MTKIEKVLYTGKTHATRGRDGTARIDDAQLNVKLSPPATASLAPIPSSPLQKANIAALESASEGTRVGVLSPTGLKLDSLLGDRLLRGADLLAAGDKKLFVAKSRGRAVELSVLECKP